MQGTGFGEVILPHGVVNGIWGSTSGVASVAIRWGSKVLREGPIGFNKKSTPLPGTSTPANRIARRAASEAEGSIPIVKELPGSRSRRFFAFQTCQVD